jgi:hypothetical protein
LIIKILEVIINHQSYFFVAHRKKFCNKQATFQGVLKDNNFGIWVDGMEPNSNEYVLLRFKL